jgi:hypothetical protein
MNLHLTITSNCWFARDLEQWWIVQHFAGLNKNDLATGLCVYNSWACKQTNDKQNLYR